MQGGAPVVGVPVEADGVEGIVYALTDLTLDPVCTRANALTLPCSHTHHAPF